MKVFRYRLKNDGKPHKIKMPLQARILKVRESCRPDIISIWALVNRADDCDVEREFMAVRTGEELPSYVNESHYLNTILINNEVKHIFEI